MPNQFEEIRKKIHALRSHKEQFNKLFNARSVEQRQQFLRTLEQVKQKLPAPPKL